MFALHFIVILQRKFFVEIERDNKTRKHNIWETRYALLY